MWRIVSRCDLPFQLADEIGLDLNPVSLFSMAAWDEETGEQFSTTELLNTVFSFLSVDVCVLWFVTAATKLQQGSVFTPVCHSVHRGVSDPACTTGHITRGVSVQGDLCPGRLSPSGSLSRGVSVILLECILV